jgi:hypothetical protein
MATKFDAADPAVAELYEELRRIAASYLRRERSNHTLQPTALVHLQSATRGGRLSRKLGYPARYKKRHLSDVPIIHLELF